MLTQKQLYLNDVDQVIEALQKVDVSADALISLRESISRQELLIPVIGDFSAGKSSLLNSFLGSPLLPTAVTPETSLAAELRYDVNERIEAVMLKEDGTVKSTDTYTLDDFETIKNQASKYSFLKVYLNNENIKAIQPLVLVDMPGFQSPVEQHNKAINVYLNRGAYFVILLSAQEGSLHRSSFRQISFILDYERDFSLVISKSNLVTQKNLEQISKKLSEQIDNEFDLTKTPVAVGKDGIEGFKNIIDSLNADELFIKIVSPALKKVLYDAQSSVNMKLAAIQRSDSDNDYAIKKLQESLKKIESKQDSLIKEAKSSATVNDRVQKIINRVGADLSANADSLVAVAVKQGEAAFQAEISDIMQGALISGVKSSVDEYASSITNKLSLELSDLDSLFQDYNFQPEFITKFSENVQNSMRSGLNSLNKMVETRQTHEDASKMYKAITGVLAITTSVLNPILELSIVFLPEIIGFFTKFIERQRQEQAEREQMEKIRSQILTQIIPNVKTKLKPELTKQFEEQAEALVEQITREYAGLIDNKRAEITKAQEERKAHEAEINQKIAELKEAKAVIETVQNKLYQ